MTAGALALAMAACGEPTRTASHSGAGGAEALRVTQAPTPRFRVPKYHTEGTYAQVEGAGDLRRVNAALRAVVTSDQRAYAGPARQAAKEAGSAARGLYSTSVDRHLVSASTVVVSVLMPANHLWPGGNTGGNVVSGTVMVPSGRRVGLTQLFKDPATALPVLATEWKRVWRRIDPRGLCLDQGVSVEPSAHNYRHFALLPAGLAIGFPGGHCTQMIATVPYARLRPYFSHLARVLIDGVRKPAAPK